MTNNRIKKRWRIKKATIVNETCYIVKSDIKNV